LAALACGSTRLYSQEAADKVLVDKQTLQTLLQRVDELEARVKQLETGGQPQAKNGEAFSAGMLSASAVPSANAMRTPGRALSASPMPSSSMLATADMPSKQSNLVSPEAPSAGATGQEQEPSQSENVMAERMDLSKTLLRIRGFGDVNFGGDTQHGDTTAFSLGQLDLFITSDISEKFKFLSEVVFEGGNSNIYGQPKAGVNNLGVDLERYVLQYSYNDYFNISAGRVHTAIGYYNTAYHHSTWFQTAADRPFLFAFEDRGGILPIHSVGVSASGLIPSGPLGLHYVAEVGNGRASRTPLTEEPVQNVIDDQSHKAYNVALFARPEAVRGLQMGFSAYRDSLAPVGMPRIDETILAAHAVFVRPSFEWLNEALVVRHNPLGFPRTFNTPGFYTQVSKKFGSYRPYFRYQYVNASNSEPIFPDIKLRQGPSVGVRFDASESVALKLQYDYTVLRQQPAVSVLALQIGFTF